MSPRSVQCAKANSTFNLPTKLGHFWGFYVNIPDIPAPWSIWDRESGSPESIAPFIYCSLRWFHPGAEGRPQGQLLAAVLLVLGAAGRDRGVAALQVLFGAPEEVPETKRARGFGANIGQEISRKWEKKPMGLVNWRSGSKPNVALGNIKIAGICGCSPYSH